MTRSTELEAVYGNPLQLGVTKVKDGYNFAVRSFTDELTLEIYPVTASGDKNDSPLFTVDMDESYRFGDVFAVEITGGDIDGCSYRYVHNGTMVRDDYAANLSGCSEFGHNIRDIKYITKIQSDRYDWENDRFPRIPYDECIFYKLHVRGFTKSRTSGVELSKRGTFAGVTDKIPYLRSLGITTIELMPAYEFDEAGRFASDKEKHYSSRKPEKSGCVNYWGYLGGFHFAPKAAYCAASCSEGSYNGSYTDEFRDMVKALHANGIEVVMEMYFTHEESYLIEDCLRYWVMNYHVDGFHIYCDECRLSAAADDPVLGSTKIITVYWNNGRPGIHNQAECRIKRTKHMANYNTGFDEAAKRLLKGDENQLQTFARLLRANPADAADINYVTNHNGFTMMDLVSYDRKHNEANGEGNRDGENFNYSWNCGIEGPSRKKKINELRTRQIKNAFAMLFTAQGTPLILAGDEFGNSQSGNNNPYCIDNETTWLEWKESVQARSITDFVRILIDFRKSHKIMHMDSELTAADGLSCGYPDISYHGDNAWYSRMESYDRHIGVMYCSRYVKNEPADEVIYVAYNLHWEPHHLALPDLPEPNEWKIILSTDSDNTAKLEGRQIITPPRSVTILTGSLIRTSTIKRRKRRS